MRISAKILSKLPTRETMNEVLEAIEEAECPDTVRNKWFQAMSGVVNVRGYAEALELKERRAGEGDDDDDGEE